LGAGTSKASAAHPAVRDFQRWFAAAEASKL
jgi:hypothetical protein